MVQVGGDPKFLLLCKIDSSVTGRSMIPLLDPIKQGQTQI